MPEHVPTVGELAKRGLAKVVHGTKGGAGTYQLEPAGQRLVYDAMATNAIEARAANEANTCCCRLGKQPRGQLPQYGCSGCSRHGQFYDQPDAKCGRHQEER